MKKKQAMDADEAAGEERRTEQMNERELDVLNILYAKGEPMTAIDIVNEKRDLTQSTVTAVLRKLLNAKLVEVEGIKHSGKVLSRTYLPTPRAKEAILGCFVERYKMFNKIVTVAELMDRIQA